MGGPNLSDTGGNPAMEEDDYQEPAATVGPGTRLPPVGPRDATVARQPTSYLAKLTANRSKEQEPNWWQEEEAETYVEPGDIIVGCENNILTLDLSPAFQKRLEQSLVGGPWSIFNSVLCVIPWDPNFNAITGRVDRAVEWVRFPDIPIHTYHTSVLYALGDLVGQSVKIDQATQEYQRGRFAKIAEQVNLTKPLKGTIKFRGKQQLVIYEGLPTLYYQCGRVDHTMDQCSELIQAAGQPKNTSSTVQEQSSSIAAVISAKKQSTPEAPLAKGHTLAQGSRYENLARDLDKDGGLEEPHTSGHGAWITVAETMGPRPKRKPKKGDKHANPPTKPTPQTTPANTNRIPLANITNSEPLGHWVAKSPQNSTPQPKQSTITQPNTDRAKPYIVLLTDQHNNTSTSPPTYVVPSKTGHHTVVPTESIPLELVISRQTAEATVELSSKPHSNHTKENSPLQRTRPKTKPPDLNSIETKHLPSTSSDKSSKWRVVLKKTKSPSFKRRAQRGGYYLVSEEKEAGSMDDATNSTEHVDIEQTATTLAQGNPPISNEFP
ncbi:hypothetical protein Tsubulata_016887 [Turnera subulata]|uniref:DUF4283 domain-containing protein n=1 Tax=Turnera subulata TaxID=218843 RepID=A0A9Q0FXN4_9ROSI|nr:hypothetical protein Tsubulata_016887 [Turnera subulata]